MHLALYQPDIPQNTGTILRMCACLVVPVHLIEPAGFALSNKAFRRAGLDYAAHANLKTHASYDHFLRDRPAGRLILLSTKAEISYLDTTFQPTDTLLLGRESAGVPSHVHNDADLAVKIPIAQNMRSLNIAVAGAIVLAEALRQTGSFAKLKL